MAKQTAVSNLKAKMRPSVQAHIADPVSFGMGSELPGGIRTGIAQLVDIKFDSNKNGDYFYAAGIVVEPAAHEGQTIKGLRTSINEPVENTPDKSRKTVDEHVAWIMNEFRKLMGVTVLPADFDPEATAAALKQVGPYFKFSTRTSDKQEVHQSPNGKWTVDDKSFYGTEVECKKAHPYAGREPMVFHTWNGAVAYNPVSDDSGSGVVDNTVSSPEPEVQVETQAIASPAGGVDLDALASLAATADPNNQTSPGAVATRQLEAQALAAGVSQDEIDNSSSWSEVADMIRARLAGGGPEDGGDGENYVALGVQADGGDETAIDRLTAVAQEAGVDDDTFNSMTWAELVTHLVGLATGGGEAPAEFVPKKGSVVLYKAFDPKTKKPSVKAEEHDVATVDAKNKTVTLINMTTKKPVVDLKTKQPKAVPWSELEVG